MQLIKCSIDGVRPNLAPAAVFWAWRDLEGVRHAWRQRLCDDHLASGIQSMDLGEQLGRLHCPACHIDTEDDYVPVYATVFVRHEEPLRLQLPLCAPCSLRVKQYAEQGSESLPDRDVGVANSTPTPTARETLVALGRR
jgi:hypothetical protein